MKKGILIGLTVIFAAVFLVSGWYLLDYFMKSEKAENEYAELAQIVEDARQEGSRPGRPGEVPQVEETPEETKEPWIYVQDPETGDSVAVLPEYSQLYTMNNHLVGWIQIPGTGINYPVLQEPEHTDFYLKRNFYREYSDYGAIYVKEDCDVERPSDNVTVYGHRMNDGSMFADLHKYKEEEFYREYPYIYFDTLTEYHTYEILLVFLISSTVTNTFQYHMLVDAGSREEFDEFVSQCRSRSLYDTGVTADFGDKLITLSTCEYSNYNGRLVVVAKRVE